LRRWKSFGCGGDFGRYSIGRKKKLQRRRKRNCKIIESFLIFGKTYY
jgi:hypothetical protein